MNQRDLNKIREDYPDHDQWCPIKSQGICTCPKDVIDDLLQIVEQFANVIKIASSPEYEDGQWNFLIAIDNLPPEAKALLK